MKTGPRCEHVFTGRCKDCLPEPFGGWGALSSQNCIIHKGRLPSFHLSSAGNSSGVNTNAPNHRESPETVVKDVLQMRAVRGRPFLSLPAGITRGVRWTSQGPWTGWTAAVEWKTPTRATKRCWSWKERPQADNQLPATHAYSAVESAAGELLLLSLGKFIQPTTLCVFFFSQRCDLTNIETIIISSKSTWTRVTGLLMQAGLA